MLGIVAMVGDAKALSHLQDALERYAALTCVHNATELATQLACSAPDIIALDMKNASQPTVRLTVRQTIERFPATRVVLACRIDAADMRALARVRLEVWELVLVHFESPAMTRSCLLSAANGRMADMMVGRMVRQHSPEWIHPFVEWCAEHDGIARPDVRSLAKNGNMRRETLSRLCKARGVCPPNQILSWMIVLRATARMCGSGLNLAAIARELGLASGGSLSNLFVRRTGQTPTQIRTLGLECVADRAVREMFGQRPEDVSLAETAPTGRARDNIVH
jgi:AraC-like DNA-binding protein